MHRSLTKPATTQAHRLVMDLTLTWILLGSLSINMDLTLHRVNDPEKNLLVDQQWEFFDPILSCTNLQDLPIHFLINPEELMV